MFKIIAIFKGEDGSMGYKNGQKYHLQVSGNMIHPFKNPECQSCLYSTISSFIQNWQIL